MRLLVRNVRRFWLSAVLVLLACVPGFLLRYWPRHMDTIAFESRRAADTAMLLSGALLVNAECSLYEARAAHTIAVGYLVPDGGNWIRCVFPGTQELVAGQDYWTVFAGEGEHFNAPINMRVLAFTFRANSASPLTFSRFRADVVYK